METVNGVRRELYQTRYQRLMRFYVNHMTFERASVLQGCDLDSPSHWGRVDVTFTSLGFGNYNSTDSENLSIVIEAFRQAKEVADAWAKDTGKEISEK